MIFINLLSVLVFIYHFVKIIFTEQAGVTSFPREKNKGGEDILKGLLSKCYFYLNFAYILWMLAGVPM